MSADITYVAYFKRDLSAAEVEAIKTEFNGEVETIKTGHSERWLIKVPTENYARMIAFLKPSRIKQFCITFFLHFVPFDVEILIGEYALPFLPLA